MNSNNDDDSTAQQLFLATGVMEDRAVIEAIKFKFIKRATAVKFPEVRSGWTRVVVLVTRSSECLG